MSLEDAVNAFNNAHYSENTESIKAQNTQEKEQPKQDDNKTTLNWKYNPDNYTPEQEFDGMDENTAPAQTQPAQEQTQTTATPEVTQAQTAQTNNKPEHRYSFHTFAELCKQPKAVPYLIKDYVRANGLELLYGESGCCKTFSIIDMIASIACPEIETWHGHKINKHGGVVYFAGEGLEGLNARFQCWAQERGINPDNINLAVCNDVFALDAPTDGHSLEQTIAEIKMIKNPVLVVFDTLNTFMAGEENSNTAVGSFLRLCRLIRDNCGVTVLIVHHASSKTEVKGEARGATALRAAMDIQLRLTRSSDILTLKVEKSKDDKPAPDLIFKLTEHVIEGWEDEDGNPVTSCTLEIAEKLMQFKAEQLEQEKAEKKKPKYTDAQLFALKTYREAAKKHGFIVVDNETTQHSTVFVDVEKWRKTLYDLSAAENEDSKRVQFKRAREFTAQKTEILAIKRDNGKEYYTLDLSGNADPTYKMEIISAIKEREEMEAQEKKAAEATEADTTGNLFKA